MDSHLDLVGKGRMPYVGVAVNINSLTRGIRHEAEAVETSEVCVRPTLARKALYETLRSSNLDKQLLFVERQTKSYQSTSDVREETGGYGRSVKEE